jgi:hypothetical protein
MGRRPSAAEKEHWLLPLRSARRELCNPSTTLHLQATGNVSVMVRENNHKRWRSARGSAASGSGTSKLSILSYIIGEPGCLVAFPSGIPGADPSSPERPFRFRPQRSAGGYLRQTRPEAIDGSLARRTAGLSDCHPQVPRILSAAMRPAFSRTWSGAGGEDRQQVVSGQ